MQVAPEQGAFLTRVRARDRRAARDRGRHLHRLLVALHRARARRRAASCVTCDISEEWTSVARRYWEKAGVADRSSCGSGPGADTLRALPREPVFDLGFIDADKPGYPVYYEEILKRLRPGGVILVDNVLWTGRVADPDGAGRDDRRDPRASTTRSPPTRASTA